LLSSVAGGGLVTDPRLERLFASLDASFDAALAREEDEAATDLALSLRHDLPLTEVVLRGSWSVRLAGGAQAPVTVAGRDFIGTDGSDPLIVPVGRAVLQAAPCPRPRGSDLSLLELLRIMARRAAKLQIDHPEGRVDGRVCVVGAAYLIVETAIGRCLVGLHAVTAIRLGDVRWGDVL
jgi:hypothetical protein